MKEVAAEEEAQSKAEKGKTGGAETS